MTNPIAFDIISTGDLASVSGGAGLPWGSSDPFYLAKRSDPRYRTWRGGPQEGTLRLRYMFPHRHGGQSAYERKQLGLPM